MANQNFRIKKGIEVGLGGTFIFADDTGVGFGSAIPTRGIDSQVDVLLQKNLEVTGLSTFVGISTFESDVFVGRDLFVQRQLVFADFEAETGRITGILTVNNFDSTGIASFVDARPEYLQVGVSTFQGEARFEDAIFTEDVVVGGAISAATGNFSFTNLTGENILFTGLGTFSGQVFINNLAVTGPATLATLDVTGITTLGDADPVAGFVTTRGDLYVGGDLFVRDDIFKDEISGRNLNITGVGTIAQLGVNTLTVNSVDVLEDLNVEGNVSIGGSVSIDVDLNITGIATARSLDIVFGRIGVATMGIVGINSTLTVNGPSTFIGTVTSQDDAYFEQDVNILGDLNVTGDIIYDEITGRNLSIAGIATINTLGVTTDVTIGRDLQVDNDLTVTNDVQINRDLAVAGLTTLTQGLRVVGPSTFVGVGTFIDDLYVGGDLSVVGRLEFTDISGENLEITGIATLSEADIEDAVVGYATITGANIGVATITGDLSVEGNLKVTGDISYDEVSGRNLNISGVGTVVNLESDNFDADQANINVGVVTDFTAEVATIEDEVVGTSTVTYALITDELVGVSSIGLASITKSETTVAEIYEEVVGFSTVGFATITDGYIGVATVGLLTVTGESRFIGLVTSTTDVYVGEDLYVAGNLDLGGNLVLDDISARNITISGVATLNQLEVTTDTELQRNLEVAGLSTLTGIVTTGTDVFVGNNLSVAANTDIVGDLTVQGSVTVTGDITYDEVVGRNLNITGVGTITNLETDNFDADQANINVGVVTDFTAEVATIEDEVVGTSTITSADIEDATVEFADIEDADIGIATIAYSNTTDANVGVATIAYGNVTDLNVGIATIQDLRVGGATTMVGDLTVQGSVTVTGDISYDEVSGRNLNISGVGTINQLGVNTFTAVDAIIGVATITTSDLDQVTAEFADIEDARAGVLTVTRDLVVSGLTTLTGIVTTGTDVFVGNDLSVAGNLALAGDIQLENIFAANLNVSGTGRINTGIITDLSAEVATIQDEVVGTSTITYALIEDELVGVSTVGYSDIADARIGFATVTSDLKVDRNVVVTGLSTFSSNARFAQDVTVEGDLNVTGDIVYDEITGRNLSIAGIATIADLEVENDLDVGQNLDVVGIATVGVLSTANALIGIATVGVLTAKDGFFETLTFGSGGGGGGGGDGTGINSESVRTGNLVVTGIASITTGIITNLTVEVANITDEIVGTSTITTADITDATIDFADIVDANIGVATVGLQTVTTNLFVGDKFSVVGTSSFFADVFVDGNINVTGSQNVESFGAVNLEVTGIATISDADITDARVGVATIGIASVTTLEVTTAGVYDATVAILTAEDSTLGTATVTYADITDALVGVETVGYADITDASVGVATILSANIGVATITGDLTIEGNVNVTGDIRYDEVTGKNIDISGVGTISQLGVNTFTATDAAIGVATIGYADVDFADIVDARAGVLTVTGISSFQSDVSIVADVTIDGNLNISGSQNVQSFGAVDLEITGIATIATSDVTDAAIGVATIGYANVTDLNVGITTTQDLRVGGATTIVGDLTVQGSVTVTGDISYDEVSGRNLNITGVGTISQLGVSTFTATDSTLGVATITAADIDATTIEFANITEETVGISTIGYADITDAAIGVATITAADIDATTIEFANITDETVGVSTIGFATVTDGFIGVLTATTVTITGDLDVEGDFTLTGDVALDELGARNINVTGVGTIANLGVSSLSATDSQLGVSTITFADVTESVTGLATISSANIGVATITGDLTVQGSVTVTGDISYDEVSGRNLNITGVGTIAQLGVTTFAADVATVGVLTATDADLGIATVGLASVNLLEVSDVVGYSATFTDFKVTGAVSLPGIPIQGGDAEFRNLNITGLSSFSGLTTFSSDVFVDGNLTVSGIRIEETVAGENLLVTGIATIVAGVFTSINVAELSTLNDAGIGVATIGYADITDAQVGVLTITTGTIGFANITEETVGISTIGFATVTDGFIGVLTATTVEVTGNLEVQGDFTLTGDTVVDELTARNLDVTGIGTIAVLEATDADLGVATVGYADVTDSAIGVATIGYANVTDLNVGVTTTQDLRVGGATTMVGDLTVQGSVTVTGDISYDEVSGRNLNITGVGTINQLGVNTFTAVDATVGILTVTTIDSTTLDVSGVSTLGGQVNLGGSIIPDADVTYDLGSLTNRFNDLYLSGSTIDLGGIELQNTAGELTVDGEPVLLQDIGGNINVSGVTTTNDLDVTQNAQIAGIATISDADITDARVGVLTATTVTITGDLEVQGDFALTGDVVLDEIVARGLSVTGIATINDLEVNILDGGNATFESTASDFASAIDAAIGVATITTADVGFVTATNAFVSGVVTSTNGFEGNLTGNTGGTHTGDQEGDVYSRDGSQLVLQVPVSTGTATYTGNVTGDVNGDTTGTHFGTNIGQQDGDVYTADGATLVVDTAAVPAPIFKGDAEGLTGTPDIDVRDISARDITSSGVTTLTSVNIGVATVTGDLDIQGNVNVTGDIRYDEVVGRNLNISGIATFNDVDINGFTTFERAVGVALTVTDLVVTGIATLNGVGIATEGGDVEFNSINITGVATVGVLSTADALIGIATVGLVSTKNLEFTTGNGFELEVQSLTVPNGGFVSLPGIPVSNGSATFAELSVTGVSTFGGIATFTNDVYVDGDLFVTGDQVFEGASAVNLTVSGVLTATNITSSGIQTFSDTRIEDATIAFANVTDLNAGVATISVANVTESVTGLATISSANIGVATITGDLTVQGSVNRHWRH